MSIARQVGVVLSWLAGDVSGCVSVNGGHRTREDAAIGL
jgi:hypothetical protein